MLVGFLACKVAAVTFIYRFRCEDWEMTHVKGNTTAGTWEAVGEAESEPEICLPEICIHWPHSDPKHLQLMTAL